VEQEKNMAPRIKSISQLRKELAAKERELGKLRSRRSKLAGRLDSIDKKIAALGGTSGGAAVARKRISRVGRGVRRGRRPKGEAPLVEYIKRVLAKEPKGIRIKNIVKGVLSAGYKTGSKDFYGIVAPTLRDMPEVKKVSRGVYKLK
jgi:hypothetical protein